MKTELDANFVALIQDQKNWAAFQDLFNAAATIVGDFDAYGEVLQSADDGRYDETTDIEKLRGAIVLIDPDMVPHGDFLPWLTEEQQKRLEEVAAECVAAADGEGDDIETARLNVETMTPLERLEATGYKDGIDRHVQIKKRLGFDPDTGIPF